MQITVKESQQIMDDFVSVTIHDHKLPESKCLFSKFIHPSTLMETKKRKEKTKDDIHSVIYE